MNTNRDFDRIAGAWLAEGPSELADRVLDAALDEVHLTRQRRRLAVPWRTPLMPMPLRLVAAVAIIAIVGYAGLTFLNPAPGGPGAQPTPTPSPTVSATPTPGPTATPTLPPMVTADWAAHGSERYGFSIDYPADWTVEPATQDWTMALAEDFTSAASEKFTSGEGDVLVTVWSVAVVPGTTDESWIEEYCQGLGCSGIVESALPVTIDGHSDGLLSVGQFEVQAFLLVDDRMYVVACWRGDDDPEVAKYGGSRRLIEAFLSTMHLLPVVEATASPTPS